MQGLATINYIHINLISGVVLQNKNSEGLAKMDMGYLRTRIEIQQQSKNAAGDNTN